MDRFEILKEVEYQPSIVRDLKGWDPNGWSMPVETPGELVKKLNRQIYGFKDRHDRVIDSFLKKIEVQGALHGN
jgi:hypothetical protein